MNDARVAAPSYSGCSSFITLTGPAHHSPLRAGVFERQGETGRPSLAAVTPALCGSHSVIFFHS